MRLSAQEIDTVKEETGISPVNEESDAHQVLVEHFGEHTFYADAAGLFVWEPVKTTDDEEGRQVAAVKLAEWTDETRSSLRPQPPEVTNVTVRFGD